MAIATATLTRKSFFIDPKALGRAKRVLKARTDAEAVRLSVQRVAEMDQFLKFLKNSSGVLKPGSFEQ